MMPAVLPPIFMFEYTLLTSTGRVLLFSIKSCAELYQQIHGGVVITQHVIDNPTHCDILVSTDNKRNQNVYTA